MRPEAIRANQLWALAINATNFASDFLGSALPGARTISRTDMPARFNTAGTSIHVVDFSSSAGSSGMEFEPHQDSIERH